MTMLPEYKPQYGETLRQAFEGAREAARSRDDGRCLLVFNGAHYRVRASDEFEEWVGSSHMCEGDGDFHAQIIDRLAAPSAFLAEIFRATCSEEAKGILKSAFDGVRTNGH